MAEVQATEGTLYGVTANGVSNADAMCVMPDCEPVPVVGSLGQIVDELSAALVAVATSASDVAAMECTLYGVTASTVPSDVARASIAPEPVQVCFPSPAVPVTPAVPTIAAESVASAFESTLYGVTASSVPAATGDESTLVAREFVPATTSVSVSKPDRAIAVPVSLTRRLRKSKAVVPDPMDADPLVAPGEAHGDYTESSHSLSSASTTVRQVDNPFLAPPRDSVRPSAGARSSLDDPFARPPRSDGDNVHSFILFRPEGSDDDIRKALDAMYDDGDDDAAAAFGATSQRRSVTGAPSAVGSFSGVMEDPFSLTQVPLPVPRAEFFDEVDGPTHPRSTSSCLADSEARPVPSLAVANEEDEAMVDPVEIRKIRMPRRLRPKK
jgi:hypothetical protein